jgi:hypothetical protein
MEPSQHRPTRAVGFGSDVQFREKLTWHGSVFPRHDELTIRLPREITVQDHRHQFWFAAKIEIEASVVRVVMSLSRYEASFLDTLYSHAIHLSRQVVNAYSYSDHKAYVVVIDSFTDPDGERKNLIYQAPALSRAYEAFSSNPESISEFFDFVCSDRRLTFALNDLMICLTVPDEATICACRAVETIRNIACDNDENVGRAWRRLRELLHLSKDWLHMVTDSSTLHRHGRREFLGEGVGSEVTLRAFTVMERYRQFVRHGGDLPAQEYPML